MVQYRLLVESTSENCPPHLAALQRELAQGLTLPPEVAGEVLLQKSYHGKRSLGPKGRGGDGRVSLASLCVWPCVLVGNGTPV